MNNIEIIDSPDPLTGEVVQHVIIDRGNGEFTSMPKSVYDEMIEKQKAGANGIN